MFGNFGPWELILIFLVALLVFGARRLPEIGGSLGKGIREFKKSVRDIEGELTRPTDEIRREIRNPGVPTAVQPGQEANRADLPGDTRSSQ